MATIESYRELLKLLSIASKVCGMEIWTAPGQYLPASYYLSFHVIVYFICSIYTLNKYSHDPLHMMKILITLGTALQLFYKFFIYVSNGFEFKAYTDLVEERLLKPFQAGTPEEVKVLKRTGRLLWMVYRLMTGCFIGSAFCFGLYPVFAYYAKGEVMPLFLYELPYYDWSTTGGYVANMLFQVNLYVLGVVGASVGEYIFVLYAMYALANADIFMVHLRELEAILNDPTLRFNDCAKDMSTMRAKWMECMYDHQQSVRFFNTIEELFKIIVLFQVIFGVFSICDGMLLVALSDWYAAYFFLGVLFVDVSTYFVVGHLVELKMDEMYDTIISMPWYNLPIVNQKEFCFVLSRQQRPMILTICDFAPLNFATYMSVLRGLYQFFVMIMNYVI